MSFFVVRDVGLDFGGSIPKILRVIYNKMLMTSSFQCLTKSMRRKGNHNTKVKVIGWSDLLLCLVLRQLMFQYKYKKICFFFFSISHAEIVQNPVMHAW